MPKILILTIGWGIAFLILKYRWSIYEFTGDINFAEKYFGSQGTKNFIVIMGVLLFIFSLMYFLGTFQSVFVPLFEPFF